MHTRSCTTTSRAIRGEEQQSAQPFSAADALRAMDGAGVQAAILVPPWWEGERNDLALAAAQAHPDRFAVMGLFDADAADARARLAAWRGQGGMLGFRFSSQDPKYRTALADGSDGLLMTSGGCALLWPVICISLSSGR